MGLAAGGHRLRPVEFIQDLADSKSRAQYLDGRTTQRKAPAGLQSCFGPEVPFPGSLPPSLTGWGEGGNTQVGCLGTVLPSTRGLQLVPGTRSAERLGVGSVAATGGSEAGETPSTRFTRLESVALRLPEIYRFLMICLPGAEGSATIEFRLPGAGCSTSGDGVT